MRSTLAERWRRCGRSPPHESPLPARGAVWKAQAACAQGRRSMLSIAITEADLEVALDRGLLACPGCSAPLSPWGFARSREVRMRHGTRSVRPRRALCHGCGATHVVCPSWSVPRRRDGAEVIGEALLRAAGGEGHRRIARRLGRPPGTVRGWLRAGRSRAQSLRMSASRLVVSLDHELVAVTPAGSEPGRRGRGDHAGCPRVGAAVRSPRRRPVGARGVAHRRAAARSPAAPAVADSPRGRAPARPHRHQAAHGGCGSSAAATLHCT